MSFVQNIVNPIISLIFKVQTLEKFKTVIWGTHTELPIGSFIQALFNFIILSFTIFLIVELSEKTNILVEKEDSDEVKILRQTNENFEKQIELQQKQLQIMESLLQLHDKNYVKQEQLTLNSRSEKEVVVEVSEEYSTLKDLNTAQKTTDFEDHEQREESNDNVR